MGGEIVVVVKISPPSEAPGEGAEGAPGGRPPGGAAGEGERSLSAFAACARSSLGAAACARRARRAPPPPSAVCLRGTASLAVFHLTRAYTFPVALRF